MFTSKIKLFTTALLDLFRSLNYRQQLFLFFYTKKPYKKNLNFFDPKSGVNPFKKFDRITPNIKLFSIALFDHFSSLTYRQKSFLIPFTEKNKEKMNSDSKWTVNLLSNMATPNIKQFTVSFLVFLAVYTIIKHLVFSYPFLQQKTRPKRF